MDFRASFDSHRASDTGASFAPSARAAVTRLVLALAFAIMLAFGISLQFLVQTFVWRNWPIGEVLAGWLYILRDRVIVATLITLPVVAFGVLRTRAPMLRAVLLAASVVSGALLGEWLVRLLYGQNNDFPSLLTYVLRWSAIAFVAATTQYLWRASRDSADQLRRESLHRQSLEQQLANTRLTALRKQIEPHFLFNTLATVRRLHQTDPAAGAGMLANFIDYLRRVMPMLECSEVPLGDEVNLLRAYLAVTQARMSGRLTVIFQVPGNLCAARVPPLALATLVENAIKHGVAPRPSGGTVSITASSTGEELKLVVADDGVGLTANVNGGTGIGLYNVRARLATLYGSKGTVEVQLNHPMGVCSTIRLPLSGGSS
jgi:LytS/YehU family sensor histidine kinase